MCIVDLGTAVKDLKSQIPWEWQILSRLSANDDTVTIGWCDNN